MIKLILTDMDGTLLNSKGEIDDDFWSLEKELSRKNVIFSIASGRPYYNLVEKFKDIKDNLLFICENGSLVMYREKEIFSNPMSDSTIDKIIEISDSIDGIVPVYCGKTSAYVEKNLFNNSSTEVKEEIGKYYNKLALVEDIKSVSEEFIKVAICDFKISEKNSFLHFNKYRDEFQVVVSGKVWLDLSKLGTDKGIAVKEIQEKLNISYEETMAFGDYLNDYEMMKLAKYSYAMKNAHPELIKISNYITEDDNNHSGVTNTIKKIFNL